MFKWLKFKKTKQRSIPASDDSVMVFENGIALLINKVNVRPFYDTEWEISISTMDEHFSCKIVRYDGETASNLANIIRNAPYEQINKEFVLSLDEKSKIFYD